MFEKVNPMHPDKIADRIAGALVDLAYKKQENPKVAIEVLLGHSQCHIIAESTYKFEFDEVNAIVQRLVGINSVEVFLQSVPQDVRLNNNQAEMFRCGDNGIFKGVPLADDEIELTSIAKSIYSKVPYDGKYILDNSKLVICQSNCENDMLNKIINRDAIINPIGYWTGGINVDSGATNRKLGSDMGMSITGGGLHGKDLSKADVSVNIYAWLKAQETKQVQEFSCAIGDTTIDGKSYAEIVQIAKQYIDSVGGFEKFAEWGLIR